VHGIRGKAELKELKVVKKLDIVTDVATFSLLAKTPSDRRERTEKQVH